MSLVDAPSPISLRKLLYQDIDFAAPDAAMVASFALGAQFPNRAIFVLWPNLKRTMSNLGRGLPVAIVLAAHPVDAVRAPFAYTKLIADQFAVWALASFCSILLGNELNVRVPRMRASAIPASVVSKIFTSMAVHVNPPSLEQAASWTKPH